MYGCPPNKIGIDSNGINALGHFILLFISFLKVFFDTRLCNAFLFTCFPYLHLFPIRPGDYA